MTMRRPIAAATSPVRHTAVVTTLRIVSSVSGPTMRAPARISDTTASAILVRDDEGFGLTRS